MTTARHDFPVAESTDIYTRQGDGPARRRGGDARRRRRPAGRSSSTPGAVAIAALDADDRLMMIHQYRHPLGRRLWELPAGLLDVAGEDPLDDRAAASWREEAGSRGGGVVGAARRRRLAGLLRRVGAGVPRARAHRGRPPGAAATTRRPTYHPLGPARRWRCGWCWRARSSTGSRSAAVLAAPTPWRGRPRRLRPPDAPVAGPAHPLRGACGIARSLRYGGAPAS